MNKNKIKGYIAWIIFALLSLDILYKVIENPKFIINIVVISLALYLGRVLSRWMTNINKKDNNKKDDVNE